MLKLQYDYSFLSAQKALCNNFARLPQEFSERERGEFIVWQLVEKPEEFNRKANIACVNFSNSV